MSLLRTVLLCLSVFLLAGELGAQEPATIEGVSLIATISGFGLHVSRSDETSTT